MRRGLARYSVEIAIALLGTLAAMLEAILVDRTDIALLVAMYSFLLALAVAAVRHDIVESVREATSERRVLSAIPDARWREEAVAELDRLRLSFSGWADGTRRVPEQSSLNFQIQSLRSSTASVRAIHVAMNSSALAMWDDRHRGYDRLVDAYRGLANSVEKRRILVLDATDENLSSKVGSARVLSDASAIRVCGLQTAPQDEGGLGFELRVLWLKPLGVDVPPNLLLVDDREACTIENRGEDRYTDLEVTVNPTQVRYHVRRFEDLWTAATPVEHCLPSAAS